MTLAEALNSTDMDETVDRMTAYVCSRLKTVEVKDLEGKTPEDFVGDILMKVAAGERDWLKAQCSFREFLFGCLRSHMNNFFKTFEPRYETDLQDRATESGSESELKNIAIKILQEDGADKDEIDVFRCWVDGVDKSSAVADYLEKKVKDVYNITKRLARRMPKLRSQIKKLI